jgi:hypothetical protein
LDTNRNHNNIAISSERSFNPCLERQVLDLGKGKSDSNYHSSFNTERRNGVMDLKRMKSEFISKQKKYLKKKVEYLNKKILPSLICLDSKETIEDYQKEDVYKEINVIHNEPEFVKKFLITKESSVPNTFRVKPSIKNGVKLQDLLPDTNQNQLKRGFAIKIEKKGKDYIYQLVKEGKPESERNMKKITAIYKLQNELSNKQELTDRTRNKFGISTNELKKTSTNTITTNIFEFSKSNHFRRTLAKKRAEGIIEGNIQREIGNLNEIRKAIHETFNQAMNELYKKEAMIGDD